jgi:hypothetical protein
LGGQRAYHYFHEDITYAVSFRKMVSTNYCKLIKIITAVFEKTAILCLGATILGARIFMFIGL